jgi:predicted HicB family RNase H-like nuclease
MAEKELRTAPLGLRIRPSLKAALLRLAEADKRPLATYVELALEAHVEAKKKEGKRR